MVLKIVSLPDAGCGVGMRDAGRGGSRIRAGSGFGWDPATTWYKNVRLELGPVVEERNALLVQIRRLLLTTLRNSRAKDPTSMLRDSHRDP